MEKFTQFYGIDEQRTWNIDETGGCGVNDINGNSPKRRYMLRSGGRDKRLPEFARASRVTMLSCVSAVGNTAPPLFVFKGEHHQYRTVLIGGKEQVETYNTHRPRGALVAVRK